MLCDDLGVDGVGVEGRLKREETRVHLQLTHFVGQQPSQTPSLIHSVILSEKEQKRGVGVRRTCAHQASEMDG